MSSESRHKKKKKNKFGATSPPFIDYLKEILRRYPDGGQILKELIQNADDAGASSVVFVHDERCYGTQSLWSEELRKYQGPALYAFNDAAFTDEDWEGIQRVGRSIKQDDPSKVGRFGIGFNSVYHITDLPCVFSSKHLAIFDPQKMMFGDDQEGYRWSLNDDEDRESLLNLRDQFQPFQTIVSLINNCSWEKIIDEEQYFKGTMFRFPLRNEASEISDTLYDSRKVTELFDSFITDADFSLLFLRNVSSIALLHIDINGVCSNKLKVSASNKPFSPQDVDLCDIKQESLDRKTSFKTVSHMSQQTKDTRSQWLVTQCLLKQGYRPEIDRLANKLSFYPQVDVAFQLDEDGSLCNGRLSCFLPLPNNESNKTGLPVHINACFGLTDNRRYIKWQEEDQKNDEAAVWNELLMSNVLPLVYLLMILDAIHLSRNSALPASSVYNLWPDLTKTAQQDRWYQVAIDTLKRLFEYEIFHLADDETIWVSAAHAVFPVSDVSSDTMSAVSRLLIAQGEKLISAPKHILNDVEKIFPESDTLKRATPSLVKDVLHRSNVEHISKDDKYCLLEFVLCDERYTRLQGLKLLPLSDETFTSFNNTEQDAVLIDSEKFPRTLLPFCKERFLPSDLSHLSTTHLRKIAANKTYNIINLDATHIVGLTKKHLPVGWHNTQGHVTWKPMTDRHPPKSWLAEFWKFLSTGWDNLSDFIGVPLIPLEPLQNSGNSITLGRLQKNTTLIFQSSRGSSLPEHVQRVIKKAGCTVIKRDECLRHHDIESYVLPASPRNVLQVFLHSNRDQLIKDIASASLHEKEEVKVYLSSVDSLSNAEQNLLSVLPIFRLMSGKYVAVNSKQAVVLSTNPAIPSSLPMPESIVQCANEADRRLLTLLNIDLLDAAKVAILLVDCIKTASFHKDEQQSIMSWILNHGNILLSQSELLLTKIKDLCFIESTLGERKQALHMYDPRNKTFQDLFEADFFPPPIYTKTEEMLQTLQRLGLRTEEKDISPENILQVIKHIEKLRIHSPNKAFKKADTLVRVLNENTLKLTPTQQSELMQMQWVPCENPKSLNGRICRTQTRGLYKPTEVRDSKFSSIVGFVMPLTSELKGNICKDLCLYDPPPAEKVLENLSVLGSIAADMNNPDSDFQFKTKLHHIYKFMQDNIDHFRQAMNTKCIPWLWNQSEFVFPRDIVLTYPSELDLSSYIKKVPKEFLEYENLLREFGVKETLTDEEIEEVLHDIKERIDDRDPPYGDCTELKVSIAILDWMRKNKKFLKDSTPVPVTAQNQNFTLQSLSKTVFCDISAEGLDDLKQDNEEFYVIHEEVLPLTARWLKVPFLSTRILKPQFIKTEQDCFGIEQCGQSEPITQRIKNILKEYDEESDIFKELIQNAEDAGASTCKFLLDFRKHRDPPETLIDEGMALCSGPCLWIFNDKLFSEEDWKNIVKVGSASKENKVEKIGKFGLGFNVVYHVSDIPSVLSGESLLILDPNVTHLEKHILSKGNPGIKLDLFQERLYKRFPGQFKPYKGIFDCDLSAQNIKKAYNGTLIKLPFRTQEEANRSEISSKVYDEERINNFKHHLTGNAQTHLLFLKNIKSMLLQIVPENAFTPPGDDQIQTPLKITREVMNSTAVSNDTLLQEINSTLKMGDIKCHNIIDYNRAQIVKIVQDHSVKPLTQHWLLYSCFGTKDSMRMFQRRNENEHVFSLPIGGIAVPLHRDSQTEEWTPDEGLCGQAFCFLPLPIETGLPVHVNGTFAVTSNRKALWESGVKAEWNKALLKDAVTSAYITTLLELKKMAQNGNLKNYSFYTFWPNTERVSRDFLPMVKSFYSAVAQNVNGKSLELFSNGRNWGSIDRVKFLSPNIEENTAVGDIAKKLFLNMVEPYSCVVSIPSWVRHSFSQCDFNELIKQRTIHWPEFYNTVFNNLSTMDTRSRNYLVLNAIDLNDPAVDDLLKMYPCIPTQKCQRLQYIKKLVNPSGKVACLYELEEGRFLEGTANDFLSPKSIQRLSNLGMLSDRLPLEDIIERAEKIPRAWQQDQSKCYKRIQCLIELMKGSSEDVNSPKWNLMSQTSFLPAVAPLLHQNKKAIILKKPCEVYSDNCCNLVSMTEFTVDHTHLQIHSYDPVLQTLRVQTNPPVELVLQQLLKAHQHSNLFEKALLHNIAHMSYTYLNTHLLEQKDPSPIIAHAKSFPFIFIEDHFVNVRSVARNKGFEEKPYLYVLPAIFSQFEKLWDCVGITKVFTKEQYVSALEELKASYGSRPLSKQDIDKCVAILMKGLYNIKDLKLEACLIPDARGVLTSSKELRFNDSPWMPVSAAVTLSHELIPRPVACRFGVMTTRHHTLKNCLVEGFSPFTKEFGQTEKLTVRIKNIIEAYPSKKDILKELIQNADDAEATEIHFVWDKRQHGTEKIFGKKWTLVQGPALCVYNNKTFSDADLRGIQQLGEGGKHGTLGRTGKYGLGFNSVYHLTDCPSILTGDKWLCISDPNLKYVEGVTKESPGCMFSLEDEFKKSFEDVYYTFLPGMFTLNTGTMFRLPLRTEKMAEKSEMSIHAVTDLDMRELQSALTEDPEGLILFLKHITKIQFSVINKNEKKLQSFVVIEKKCTEKGAISKENFDTHVQKCLVSGKTEPCKTIYRMQISSGGKQSKWVIAECFGSFKQSQAEKNGQIQSKVPQAALAICKGSTLTNSFTGRAFCSLPLPEETRLPVHVNANFEVDSSRRDLWKEDGDSLKTEWNQSLKVNIVSPLYADLLLHLCEVMKKDTPTALVFLPGQLEASCLKYFPCIAQVDKAWHEMIHEVYRSVSQRDLPIIPTVHSHRELPVKPTVHYVLSSHHPDPKYKVNWCSVSQPDSADCPYFTIRDHEDIFEILDDIGMKLVPHSPKIHEIRENFKAAGVNVSEISPSTVMNFMKQRPLNDCTQTTKGLPLPINQTIIKDKTRCSKLLRFCLPKTGEETSVPNLNGLPLLLTQDQMLRVFDSQSPKMITRINGLIHRHQEMFADFSVNGKHIKVLREGKFIKVLNIALAAEYLKVELSQLLTSSSTTDQKCQLYKAEKETIEWLKNVWRFFENEEKNFQDEKQNVFSEIKKHFSDSPILPVTCPSQSNTQFLQTIKNVPTVILKSDEKILIKLGFMTLDRNFFNCITNFRYKYVDPELLQTGDSTAVLSQIYHVPHSQFKLLSDDECDELQQFLQRGIKVSENRNEYERMFKSLPLFMTICGKRERIDSHRMICILDSKHHSDFPNLYAIEDCHSIFLKNSLLNSNLAKSLNIKVLNDLEFCVKFILPSVHMMSEAKLLDLVRLLVELLVSFGPLDQRIVSALSGVRFIQDTHGSLQVAAFFYDEDIELYKIMLPEDRFVPKKFWDIFKEKQHSAKYLLKELGLKHQVSDEEISQFAAQIERDTEGNTPLDVLQKRSRLLFQMVITKSYENSNILGRVANIKFIFPVKIQPELCAYHRPFAQERQAVAIRGSLLEGFTDCQYLIWTSMPIIPLQQCSSQFKKKMITAGALDTPTPEKISDHLRNISSANCQKDSLLKTRVNVFSKSYAYLQSTNFDGSLFSNLPIILVEKGTKLVKVSQTALIVKDSTEFRPYLYNISSNYMKFEDFFKKVGVKQWPTLQQYITVLQEIYSDCSDKENLQANQQKTVKRVVQQLLWLRKKDQKQTFDPKETLYLPSTDGRLYESSTLFFNDTVFQASRLEGSLEKKLKLLEKLNQCHLGNDPYKHQGLLLLLPEQIRPKFLSDFISENLVRASVQYCDYEEGCEFGGLFEKHLSSSAFLHGLICLIREESRGEVSQSEAAEKCETIFSRIQIYCCKTLETQLFLNQEPLEGSKTETDVYVQKQEDRCNFYLKHSNDMTHIVVNEVTMCLTKEINALLKNTVSTSNLPVLAQLLLCNNMEDVEKTLAKHNIHNSIHNEEGHSALPKPGCHLPEEWHDCLDMSFFNNFESGEYVGFCKDGSGEYIYAIVTQRLDDLSGQTGQYSARYKIQVGIDDFIEVSSLDLFQFKREKKVVTLTRPTCTDIEPVVTSVPPPSRDFPQTFEEVKREIDQSLTEIWKMSKEDKQKGLKRLYLQWHPDKNPDNEDLANRAFKYLKNRIKELQEGKTVHNESSCRRDFKDFFHRWNFEAASHRRGREKFYKNYSRQSYNFWSHHSETPRPNTQEAKRWYKQAECDLRAAHNDTGGDSSEWCLFKVHQAVEKGLTAAVYRRNGQRPGGCSISSLAQQVSGYSSQLNCLPNTVRKLVELGVDGKKTQYPNCHSIPNIPNGRFNVNDARTALDIATKLLLEIDQYISG